MFDREARALTIEWSALSFTPVTGSSASNFASSVVGDDLSGGVADRTSSAFQLMTVQPSRLGSTLWSRSVSDGCSVVTTTVSLVATCKVPPNVTILSTTTSRYNTTKRSFDPIVFTASVSGAAATDSLSLRWMYATVS